MWNKCNTQAVLRNNQVAKYYQGNRLLPWTVHLNAQIVFLEAEKILGNIDYDETHSRDIVLMLATYDISAFILNRKTKYHRLWARYNLGLSGIDDECGLPYSLLDLLAQLEDPNTTDALFAWQVPPGELVQVCSWNATRYAAILRALDDSKATSELDIATSLLNRGVSIAGLVEAILMSVQQCFLHVLPEANHFKQTLIYPLVMAASQRNHLSVNAKAVVCTTIQNLATEGNSYHRQGILKIIHEHWTNDAATIEETARRLDLELAMW